MNGLLGCSQAPGRASFIFIPSLSQRPSPHTQPLPGTCVPWGLWVAGGLLIRVGLSVWPRCCPNAPAASAGLFSVLVAVCLPQRVWSCVSVYLGTWVCLCFSAFVSKCEQTGR